MNPEIVSYLIFIIILLLIHASVKLSFRKRFELLKRSVDIKKVAQISNEEYKKLKKKNKNDIGHKAAKTLITIIFISTILLPILSILNLINITSVTIIILAITCGVSIVTIALLDYYKNSGYYNLDEYLFERYQLIECLDKKEELKKMKDQIKSLKLKKKNSKKFIPDEDFSIRDLGIQISKLKNKNGYKDFNGNYFEFKIIPPKLYRKRNLYTYKITCKFILDKDQIKFKEDLDKIIKKYKHLHISYTSKELEIEFVTPFYWMNYKVLANAVTYSYQACKEFLK